MTRYLDLLSGCDKEDPCREFPDVFFGKCFLAVLLLCLLPSCKTTEEEMIKSRERSLLGLQKADQDKVSSFQDREFGKSTNGWSSQSQEKKNFDTGSEHGFKGEQAKTGRFSRSSDRSSFADLINPSSSRRAEVSNSQWNGQSSSFGQQSSRFGGMGSKDDGKRYETNRVSEYQQARQEAGTPTVVDRQTMERSFSELDIKTLLGKD